MKIFSIDPSLSSTAVVIIDSLSDDVSVYSFMTGKHSKWTKIAQSCVSINFTNYDISGNYNDSELKKIVCYEETAKNIISTVNPIPGDEVLIEGYAMRAMGNIVDLVVFSTFLRKAVMDRGVKLTVVTPMTLKYEFAKMLYSVDKKGVPRNDRGLAGGKWQKKDMLEGLLRYNDGKDFINMLIEHSGELLSMKNVPSPINDCVDAYALALLKKNCKI